ncbi:hypothetical protein PPN31114_02877 [Pandoraea pneumonica]|uniref:TY-Chap central domain-containing protein n=1 Tax=Pandoraea pneumonica TaxID=2508299 RepID=A0A5E4VV85_9BURK|nr:hypothetical protein [Pandoraea pneumonica]VVE15489.1 hypothetical protein PPN31114_02877 [Pandoraea pneumonica]
MQDHIQTLLDHLQREGFSAHLDEDGDIAFKREGLQYVLCFDESDPGYGKLLLPNVYQIETQDELHRALVAMDEINRQMKVVKIYTVRDHVWLTVELWFEDQTCWCPLLARSMRALSHALTKFAEAVNASTPKPVSVRRLNA